MNANSSAASQSSPDRERPSSAGRFPSLNQLAARISVNPPSQSTNSSVGRPRLAASFLRTGSQTSLSTATSLADSVAVNAPVTRSTSPAALSTSPPNSTNGSVNGDALPSAAAATGPGEPLTVERVERLAQETAGLDKYPKKSKGFKNIPTLDAITARYARTRTLSVDGTAVPPEAEPIEDPQTPGLMTRPPEHPLQHSWCVPVVGRNSTISSQSYVPIYSRLPPSIIKDDISRHKDQGALHAPDRLGWLVPGAGRFWHLRSGLDDRRRVRYCRVLLPVLQLAQASVQTRAQLELPLVQVGYQADVGGRGKCEWRQVGAHDEEQPGVARSVLAVAYYGPCW